MKLRLYFSSPSQATLTQWEKYSPSRNTLRQVSQHTYRQLEGSDEQFHRNLRYVLELLFPRMALQDQLRKTWITETYLCSAPQEAGPVPGNAEKECASRYLSKQLDLLDGRPVIALGTKAYNRAKRIGVQDLFKAYAIAPPGCNSRECSPFLDSSCQVGSLQDTRSKKKQGVKLGASWSCTLIV